MTIELSTFGYYNNEENKMEHFTMEGLSIFAGSLIKALLKHSQKGTLQDEEGE